LGTIEVTGLVKACNEVVIAGSLGTIIDTLLVTGLIPFGASFEALEHTGAIAVLWFNALAVDALFRLRRAVVARAQPAILPAAVVAAHLSVAVRFTVLQALSLPITRLALRTVTATAATTIKTALLASAIGGTHASSVATTSPWTALPARAPTTVITTVSSVAHRHTDIQPMLTIRLSPDIGRDDFRNIW
jgi:hypothetical protein